MRPDSDLDLLIVFKVFTEYRKLEMNCHEQGPRSESQT